MTNDNAPVFLQPLVELTIEENNAPNAFLTKLDATDADSGERGQVSHIFWDLMLHHIFP